MLTTTIDLTAVSDVSELSVARALFFKLSCIGSWLASFHVSRVRMSGCWVDDGIIHWWAALHLPSKSIIDLISLAANLLNEERSQTFDSNVGIMVRGCTGHRYAQVRAKESRSSDAV